MGPLYSQAAAALAALEDGDHTVLDNAQWGTPVGDPPHTFPYRIDFPDGSALDAKVVVT